ncbi:probable deoxycytidylate deaminase isoform X2 [Drosophila serrata]|uniref:probable deoxycytidylate deaminase isoform X2 n=1 Tax=Drosophila serrata TaxID=7274 RepID=UPI000A1D140C|nr:probable deoxycytidylate deaminase isoform X2 [Drosophila serrata]
MSVEESNLQNVIAPESEAPESHKRNNYLHWDDYFMATSILSAKRSKDPVTQVGACIVDSQNRIVAIGYNGFPRNCSDDEFPWSKAKKSSDDYDPLEDKTMYVVHAEANAILNSNGASLTGTRLYTTLFPCNECTKLIIQA